MSYATLTDLVARIGDAELRQIADRDRDQIPDVDVVDAALAHADYVINGYVAVRYDVPLGSTPDLVRTWAVSIARYFLHRNGAPEFVAQDYKDAVSALKDVSAGRVALPVAVGQPALEGLGGGQILSDAPDEVFTTNRLRGW